MAPTAPTRDVCEPTSASAQVSDSAPTNAEVRVVGGAVVSLAEKQEQHQQRILRSSIASLVTSLCGELSHRQVVDFRTEAALRRSDPAPHSVGKNNYPGGAAPLFQNNARCSTGNEVAMRASLAKRSELTEHQWRNISLLGHVQMHLEFQPPPCVQQGDEMVVLHNPQDRASSPPEKRSSRFATSAKATSTIVLDNANNHNTVNKKNTTTAEGHQLGGLGENSGAPGSSCASPNQQLARTFREARPQLERPATHTILSGEVHGTMSSTAIGAASTVARNRSVTRSSPTPLPSIFSFLTQNGCAGLGADVESPSSRMCAHHEKRLRLLFCATAVLYWFLVYEGLIAASDVKYSAMLKTKGDSECASFLADISYKDPHWAARPQERENRRRAHFYFARNGQEAYRDVATPLQHGYYFNVIEYCALSGSGALSRISWTRIFRTCFRATGTCYILYFLLCAMVLAPEVQGNTNEEAEGGGPTCPQDTKPNLVAFIKGNGKWYTGGRGRLLLWRGRIIFILCFAASMVSVMLRTAGEFEWARRFDIFSWFGGPFLIGIPLYLFPFRELVIRQLYDLEGGGNAPDGEFGSVVSMRKGLLWMNILWILLSAASFLHIRLEELHGLVVVLSSVVAAGLVSKEKYLQNHARVSDPALIQGRVSHPTPGSASRHPSPAETDLPAEVESHLQRHSRHMGGATHKLSHPLGLNGLCQMSRTIEALDLAVKEAKEPWGDLALEALDLADSQITGKRTGPSQPPFANTDRLTQQGLNIAGARHGRQTVKMSPPVDYGDPSRGQQTEHPRESRGNRNERFLGIVFTTEQQTAPSAPSADMAGSRDGGETQTPQPLQVPRMSHVNNTNGPHVNETICAQDEALQAPLPHNVALILFPLFSIAVLETIAIILLSTVLYMPTYSVSEAIRLMLWECLCAVLVVFVKWFANAAFRGKEPSLVALLCVIPQGVVSVCKSYQIFRLGADTPDFWIGCVFLITWEMYRDSTFWHHFERMFCGGMKTNEPSSKNDAVVIGMSDGERQERSLYDLREALGFCYRTLRWNLQVGFIESTANIIVLVLVVTEFFMVVVGGGRFANAAFLLGLHMHPNGSVSPGAGAQHAADHANNDAGYLSSRGQFLGQVESTLSPTTHSSCDDFFSATRADDTSAYRMSTSVFLIKLIGLLIYASLEHWQVRVCRSMNICILTNAMRDLLEFECDTKTESWTAPGVGGVREQGGRNDVKLSASPATCPGEGDASPVSTEPPTLGGLQHQKPRIKPDERVFDAPTVITENSRSRELPDIPHLRTQGGHADDAGVVATEIVPSPVFTETDTDQAAGAGCASAQQLIQQVLVSDGLDEILESTVLELHQSYYGARQGLWIASALLVARAGVQVAGGFSRVWII